MMSMAAQAAQGTAAAARTAAQAPQVARGRYEASSLRVVETARVFAADEGTYVYSKDTADNEGPSGSALFGS